MSEALAKAGSGRCPCGFFPAAPPQWYRVALMRQMPLYF